MENPLGFFIFLLYPTNSTQNKAQPPGYSKIVLDPLEFQDRKRRPPAQKN